MNAFVFPMAGNSSRFFKAGYAVPKYHLDIWGTTLFEASVRGFANYFEDDMFLFITRSDFESSGFIKAEVERLGIKNSHFATVDGVTRGQAETVYLGLEHAGINLSSNHPLIIFNIDTIRPDYHKPGFSTSNANFIEVTSLPGDHWSFAEVDEQGLVTRTTEKVRISDHCSTGVYGFESAKLFTHYFQAYAMEHENELYVAPMYNGLIKDNLNVKVDQVQRNEVHFCGTPSEYEALVKEPSPFDGKLYQ